MGRLRYVIHDSDRHGNPRVYLRRPGHPKVRLPNDVGSPEFDRAYRTAMATAKPQATPEPKPEALPRAPRKTQGFVYFLRCGERVKIGFSAGFFSRVEALKTGLPDPISAFVAVPGTVADERRLHRVHAKANVVGEWFKASDPDLIRTMAAAAAYGRLPAAQQPDAGCLL